MYGDLTETQNQNFNQVLRSMKVRFCKTSKPSNDIELHRDFEQGNAVLVQNAFKNFGGVEVLHGLNLRVPKGTIYALLGASGCGKTTLLKCITGRNRIRLGTINVLELEPFSKNLTARIGYMPQEIGLHGDFTIKETFLYFGRVFGMNDNVIKKRSNFLINLLMLPGLNQVVKELSNGQQRRVSLAVAFLHEPELLILDEPTVGLDVELRELIWTYFLTITKRDNVTILITTHYIEETSRADLVGFMRGGCLLAEDNPHTLVKQNGVNSLEETFLLLSENQNVNHVKNEDINAYFASCNPVINVNCFTGFSTFKVRHIRALIWKHILWFRKNFVSFILVTFLPVILVSLFCLAIGHNPINLKVAVVNQETQNQNCNDIMSCNSSELSCHYLSLLKKRGLILLPYRSEEDAINSVHKGETYASIMIKVNYSKSMHTRASRWFWLKSKDLEQSTIEVVRDVSTKSIAIYLQVYLYQSFKTFFNNYIDICGMDSRHMTIPLQWNTLYGGKDVTFTDFSIPGVLLSVAFAIGIILTAWGMFIERNEASLERTLVMGIDEVEILISHIIVHFGIIIVQISITVLCIVLVFDATIKGSLTLTVILLLLTGLSGMCYGLLTSCISNSQIGIMLITTGTYFSILMTNGLIWPIEAMHPLLRSFAVFLPLTKATNSLRNIFHRGWDFTNQDVYVGYLSVIAWGFIFLLVSILLTKRHRN